MRIRQQHVGRPRPRVPSPRRRRTAFAPGRCRTTDTRVRCRRTPSSGAGPRTGARTPCRGTRTRPSVRRIPWETDVSERGRRFRPWRGLNFSSRPISISVSTLSVRSLHGPRPHPLPLGAGYLILVVRELSGLSQRALAHAIGTSQPTLATLETGNRVPTNPNAPACGRCDRARARDRPSPHQHPGAEPHRAPRPRVRSARDAQAEPAGRPCRLRRAPGTESARRAPLTTAGLPAATPQPDSRAARFSS